MKANVQVKSVGGGGCLAAGSSIAMLATGILLVGFATLWLLVVSQAEEE
jgi:hypothetical protein